MALTAGVKHYVRCRHKGTASGLSAWGEVRSFTPKQPFLTAETAKLIDATGASNQEGGYSVAVSGDGSTVAIGNRKGTGSVANTGTVLVYTKVAGTWTLQSKLSTTDGAANDYFGWGLSLSLDGNLLVIGSRNDTDKGATSGSVFVYKRTGTAWAKQAKLLASDGVATDLFGSSVAISRDGLTIAIGSTGQDPSAIANTGAIYVFNWTGTAWAQQAKLIASTLVASALLGTSVNISSDGNVILAGAPGDKSGTVTTGAAYVFTRTGTTWAQTAKIVPTGTTYAAMQFGVSVALSSDGTIAAIGAINYGASSTNIGRGYIFTQSAGTWSIQATIDPPAMITNSKAGLSIDLNAAGDALLIGSYMDSTSLTNAGVANFYQYESNAWVFKRRIIASDSTATNYFSRDLSISDSGSLAIIGAYGNLSLKGASYIFS